MAKAVELAKVLAKVVKEFSSDFLMGFAGDAGDQSRKITKVVDTKCELT